MRIISFYTLFNHIIKMAYALLLFYLFKQLLIKFKALGGNKLSKSHFNKKKKRSLLDFAYYLPYIITAQLKNIHFNCSFSFIDFAYI